MGLSLEAFAALVGIQSRGRMSVIERENACSLRIALKIEELSDGRVDAATLSEDVRLSRHAMLATPESDETPTGQCDDMSGACAGEAA